MNLNLTTPLDYIIAISGIFIIAGSFIWNIYDIYLRDSFHSSDSGMR